MYSQEGNGNGQREQEVTSPTHYIFEQFQNSYQFRIPFTNPEKIFELLCPFLLSFSTTASKRLVLPSALLYYCGDYFPLYVYVHTHIHTYKLLYYTYLHTFYFQFFQFFSSPSSAMIHWSPSQLLRSCWTIGPPSVREGGGVIPTFILLLKLLECETPDRHNASIRCRCLNYVGHSKILPAGHIVRLH